MNTQTLKFLGIDSGFGEKNTSAYFETAKSFNLIDCGFSVFNILKEKFDFKKYEEINIIVTHLHNDHAGSLSQFILYLWFVFNKKVNVISKCEKIVDYLDITGTPRESYEILSGTSDIELIKTTHSPLLDTYGFNLKLNNTSIIYTSDTSTLVPFYPYLKDADELYVDVSKFGGIHIKIDDVLDELIEINSSKTNIYLMHLDDKEYIAKVISDKLSIVK